MDMYVKANHLINKTNIDHKPTKVEFDSLGALNNRIMYHDNI